MKSASTQIKEDAGTRGRGDAGKINRFTHSDLLFRRVSASPRLRVKVLFAVLLLFVCSTSAAAIPVSAYRERVRNAITALGSVGIALEDEGVESSSQSDREAVKAVRAALPASETIEWQGSLIRVDNSWLMEDLDIYEKMRADDPQRTSWLARISERLQALDERLAELERGAPQPVNKDDEKARLAAILRRPEYNNQAPEGNALSRLLERIRDWLRRLLSRGEPANAPPPQTRVGDAVVQAIVFLLSFAVIVWVAWKFLPRFLRGGGKKREKGKREARVVLGEQLAAEQTSADLLSDAETLARAGDIRGAIRKGYIALLCELHDRKLLRLAQHKTNRDYLRSVESNRALHDEMKPLTASFENHWYGFIPAEESDWQSFRAHYRNAVQSAE